MDTKFFHQHFTDNLFYDTTDGRIIKCIGVVEFKVLYKSISTTSHNFKNSKKIGG